MNILAISARFPPYATMGSTTVGKMTKYLHRAGNEVRVVTCADQAFPTTLPIEIPSEDVVATCWLGSRLASRGSRDGVRTGAQPVRTKVIGRYFGDARRWARGIVVPDPYAGWIPSSVVAALRSSHEVRPDVILTSGPPHSAHVAGAVVGSALGVPLVCHLRDLWSQNPYEDRAAVPQKLNVALERWVLARARGLVASTEAASARLQSSYGDVAHLVYRPWFDVEDLVPELPGDPKVKDSTESIEIVHAGSLYEGRRDPRGLLTALARDRQLTKRVRFTFYGPSLGWFRAWVEDRGFETWCSVRPEIPRDQALARCRRASALLLMTWDGGRDDHTIPGKLYEYLALARPILHLGRSSPEIQELLAGLDGSASSGQVEECIEVLRRLVERPPPESNGHAKTAARLPAEAEVLGRFLDRCSA